MKLLLEEERKQIEAALTCPFCGTDNPPNIVNVELREDGEAFCNQCSKSWKPDLSKA